MKKLAKSEKDSDAVIAALAQALCPPVIKRLQKKNGSGKGDYSKDRHKSSKNIPRDELEGELRKLEAERKKSGK